MSFAPLAACLFACSPTAAACRRLPANTGAHREERVCRCRILTANARVAEDRTMLRAARAADVVRHPCHICTGTGTRLTPATSAPGLGSPRATSAPGLGSPRATSAPGLGSLRRRSSLPTRTACRSTCSSSTTSSTFSAFRSSRARRTVTSCGTSFRPVPVQIPPVCTPTVHPLRTLLA